MPTRRKTGDTPTTSVADATAQLEGLGDVHDPVTVYIEHTSEGQQWHVACACGEVLIVPLIPAPGANHDAEAQIALRDQAVAEAANVVLRHVNGDPQPVEPEVPEAAGQPEQPAPADAPAVIVPTEAQA